MVKGKGMGMGSRIIRHDEIRSVYLIENCIICRQIVECVDTNPFIDIRDYIT